VIKMPSITKEEILLDEKIHNTMIHFLELEIGEKLSLKLKDCNMVFERVE
jgi:hypothetical protein